MLLDGEEKKLLFFKKLKRVCVHFCLFDQFLPWNSSNLSCDSFNFVFSLRIFYLFNCYIKVDFDPGPVFLSTAADASLTNEIEECT